MQRARETFSTDIRGESYRIMKKKQTACQSDLPDQSFVCTHHPSNRESVRPTVRPVLLRRKANIVLSATTSTLFTATTKETTNEVAMNRVGVVALNTILALRLSKTRRTVGRTDSRLDGWMVGAHERLVGQACWTALQAISLLSGSILNRSPLDLKANGQPPYTYTCIYIYIQKGVYEPSEALIKVWWT